MTRKMQEPLECNSIEETGDDLEKVGSLKVLMEV